MPVVLNVILQDHAVSYVLLDVLFLSKTEVLRNTNVSIIKHQHADAGFSLICPVS